MIYKNSDSDGDSAVRDIKSRPVMVSYVKIQKIDYLSKTEPVNQVADCSS